jgi:hypothetical protein
MKNEFKLLAVVTRIRCRFARIGLDHFVRPNDRLSLLRRGKQSFLRPRLPAPPSDLSTCTATQMGIREGIRWPFSERCSTIGMTSRSE